LKLPEELIKTTLHGTYTIELTATDSFKKQAVDTKTITVNADAAPVDKIYVYGSTRVSGLPTYVEQILGDPGLDDVAPIFPSSPMERFKASDIGDDTIAVGGGTMTRVFSGSLSTLTDLNTVGNLNFSSAQQQILILFPVGSNIQAQPTSMYTGASLPANTSVSGRYALYDDNDQIPGVVDAGVHYFDLDSGVTVDGYSSWGLIYSRGTNQNNATFYIIPDSGSAPV